MASSYKHPPGYRRNDPDETEGRLLYRQLADREARQSISMARRMRLSDGSDSDQDAAPDAATRSDSEAKG